MLASFRAIAVSHLSKLLNFAFLGIISKYQTLVFLPIFGMGLTAPVNSIVSPALTVSSPPETVFSLWSAPSGVKARSLQTSLNETTLLVVFFQANETFAETLVSSILLEVIFFIVASPGMLEDCCPHPGSNESIDAPASTAV